jgi:hypothetical protein
MFKFEADVTAFEEKFDAMSRQFENFPSQMQQELTAWEVEDLNRQRPEAERLGNQSVETTIRPRGARRSRAQRALERYQRRLVRRVTPRPVRTLRRHARIGARPERVLLPAPIRRLRRMRRQARRAAAGAPTAIGRVIRPLGRVRRILRRTTLRVELFEALAGRMHGLAGQHLTWR